MAIKSIILLAALAVIAKTTSAQSTTYSTCVTSCFTSDPIASACDGDETGQAKDDCTCASFSAGDALITCIQKCPTEDQIPYAESLPAECRQNLFPNLDLNNAPASTTASAGATGSSTSTTTEATSSGDATTSSSATESSATQSSSTATASPNSAIGVQTPGLDLALGGFLAVMALV